MRFGGEEKLLDVDRTVRNGVEEEVEILEGLGEHERIHAILVLTGGHVGESSVAAWHAGVLLEIVDDRAANLEIVRITRSLEKSFVTERVDDEVDVLCRGNRWTRRIPVAADGNSNVCGSRW